MSLKKEGQIVSYTDKFVLFNEKFQMTLIFPKKSSTAASFKMEKGKHIDFSKKNVTSEKIKPDDLPLIQDLPICEQNDMFMMENAHSINISSRFKRKIGRDVSSEYSIQISFKYINYSRQRDRKDLRLGDFVQIKSNGLTKFSSGVLVSETNYSGYGPDVKFRIVTNNQFKDIFSYDSIYQLVPKRLEEYGLPLSFGGQSSCNVVLRHFLTGRLLTVAQNSDGDFIPSLSEEFSDFCQRWTSLP